MNSLLKTKPKPLPDLPEGQFVGREEEIAYILGLAQQLVRGETLPRRTVVFTGERGIGKSWLLSHTKARLEQEYPDQIAILDLDLASMGKEEPVFAMMDILEWFRQRLDWPERLPGITPADVSRAFMAQIKPLLSEKALILFVDTVYEADWKLLAHLEEYLLGPLAIEQRVLIIMAGRGRPFPWKTPELRLHAVRKALKPFKPEIIRKQLQALGQEEDVTEFIDIASGNPQAIKELVQHRDQPPAVALNEVVKGILEIVPEEKRMEIRKYLEALSVLTVLDEERIPPLLAAYEPEKREEYLTWKYPQARTVRQELLRYAFIHWDDEKGGYTMDEPTRALLENYLRQADKEKWASLHQAARDLYQAWEQRYTRSKDRWQKEAEYHKSQLKGTPLAAGYSSVNNNRAPTSMEAAHTT